MILPIKFQGGKVLVLNQLLLPQRIKYITCKTHQDICHCIKNMILRGAPLIGIAAASGLALAMNEKKFKTVEQMMEYLKHAKDKLAHTRPTAVNLYWALEHFMHNIYEFCNTEKRIDEIKKFAWKLVLNIYKDEYERDIKIGENGKNLIEKNSIVMTHCNAGGLATAGYGTALGVIRSAFKEGRIKKVIVNETRPYLQGARLTIFELMNDGIPCELITDNMAGYVMKTQKVDAVIVGADRIVSNGDVANKIGTYQLAILSKYHEIPFYVAAPMSTIDTKIASGDKIPIEERSPEEVKKIKGNYITLKDAKVLHPAFDVTPANLITAIITEKGVFRYPYRFNQPQNSTEET